MSSGVLRRVGARLRGGWEGVLAAPGGPGKVSRGAAAGAFAAMLPVFGLHLVVAGIAAAVTRASLPAAAAVCLLLGNPLTHAVLVPAEYALGRSLLPTALVPHPHAGPEWLRAAVPAATEALLGGLVFGVVAAVLVGVLARQALRSRR